jgi:hypothetical protein
VDSQGVLTPATGAGTVTYSTSVVKVGTHSAFFNQTAGAAPSVYLRYSTPSTLYTPSTLTISLWIYPTSYPVSNLSIPFTFNDGTNASNQFYINSSGGVRFNWYTTTLASGDIGSTTIILNTWTHLAVTFINGTFIFYVNGVVSGSVTTTGNMSIFTGTNMTNIFIGSNTTGFNGFAGYVDDVRIYTSALSATAIASLYNNPSLTQAVGVSSSFLPISGYITPTLPNVTANVVDARVSQTGQYMVLITSGVTNNVYYSVDYGASFTGLTIGSSPMTACSMSYDGSYLTVSNESTVYTLNRNSTGYSVAMGSQAGQINQASNAIAIGNKAGFLNQSANSIVLNASGSALNTGASGFYVSPISVTAGLPMEVLGYGSDSQIVKTGVTILPGGQFQPFSIKGFYNSGYGAEAVLAITNGARSYTRFSPSLGQGAYNGAVQAGDFGIINEDANAGIGYPNAGIVIAGWNQVAGLRVGTTAVTMFGNVGIGTTNPLTRLHINGPYNTTSTYSQFIITNSANVNCQLMINVDGSGNAYFTTIQQSVGMGNFLPGVDNSISLGSSSFRWSSIFATSGVVSTSDSKEKDSQPLPYGINELLQVRTIKYKWKSQADLPDDDPKKNFEYYGFCADELAPLFPELVYDEDTSAPVQMNYSELLPVVVNALKEEHASSVALKSVVDSQAEQISSLQSQLTATQSQLDTLLIWARAQGFSG